MIMRKKRIVVAVVVVVVVVAAAVVVVVLAAVLVVVAAAIVVVVLLYNHVWNPVLRLLFLSRFSPYLPVYCVFGFTTLSTFHSLWRFLLCSFLPMTKSIFDEGTC